MKIHCLVSTTSISVRTRNQATSREAVALHVDGKMNTMFFVVENLNQFYKKIINRRLTIEMHHI